MFLPRNYRKIKNLTVKFSAKFTAKSYNSFYRGTGKFHLFYGNKYLPLEGDKYLVGTKKRSRGVEVERVLEIIGKGPFNDHSHILET